MENVHLVHYHLYYIILYFEGKTASTNPIYFRNLTHPRGYMTLDA